MTMISNAPVPTRHRVRASVFLPAVGLIAAAATQIDAAIITNAYRSESPAPKDSLNFPWFGGLAGQISTWWSFAGLFVVIGLGALARSQALRASRAGRAGASVAVLGASTLVVANFLSAANANAMMADGIGGVIGSMFGGGTLLLGIGLTLAGVAVLRSGAWHGVARFVPLANGLWSFAMIALIFGDLLQVSIGIMAALQVALGATLIAEEA
ncbi:hypothetical protein [Nostocoides sp. HKS02]|uniref:hypothetical protein n=1 Tax=Nostocoides sp. HKS02 TaxID=1813880 RepID=UPI0012B449BC|nr:hypothetical protein [Tetrasphaera sp. HKS02]QGN58267.1 hypothetical protein GKE56_10655 [Tetrasphaera sp. HKS02]